MEVTDDQALALFRHYELLRRWNHKMSLTALRDPDEIVVRHYAESVFFASQMPDTPAGSTIADVGSGPGFPGIPMAIVQPDWRMTLIESNQRKAVFLREATRQLGNVDVIGERAERVRAGFDWIVSRAVSPGQVLALMPKVAPRVGLLISRPELDEIGFVLSKCVPVPWADGLVCAYHVPRGT